MPAVLKELMRHETIETTMKYYVSRNADATADVIWDTYDGGEEILQRGNSFGNSLVGSR